MEPSIAQLTGLHFIVKIAKLAPYVDFAVWGPHQVRTMRKLTFSGLILATDGSLHNAEVSGPASFDQWDACFQVFIAACVMLQICTITSITRYRDLIKSYFVRYVAACWPLIYQADVRVRRELVVRLRRSLIADGSITTQLPGTLSSETF